MYTEAQQDTNWDNLTQAQRDYFNHLAENDPVRTGQAFFESEVPLVLQDDPVKLDVFLNGGKVIVEEWEPARGRAGGEYVQREYTISDKDWSHDVSRANGGSDSADNGRFEDSKTNRSRGARNTTQSEQDAADSQNEFDADVLENGTIVDDIKQAADLTLAAEGAELLTMATDIALDFLAPVAGGAFAAKIASDQFEKTEHKVAAGTGAGVATAALLCTPVGQLGLGCYLTYKVTTKGYQFLTRKIKKK